MTFKAEITAKYSIRERLQTLQKKPLHPAAKKILLSYDFPGEEWTKLIEAFSAVLKRAGIQPHHTKTKSGHVSIGLIQEPTEEEIEKAKEFGNKMSPTFKVHGVEVLGGKLTPFGYISLELDLPEELRRYFQYLRKLVGPHRLQDFRTFTHDLKPHVSIVMVEKKDMAKAEELIPELVKAWHEVGIMQYTPRFIEVMENFEISDWTETGY